MAQKGKPAGARPAQNKTQKPVSPAVSEDEKPIITIGNTRVPFREFRYVYNKNNANAADANTEKSVREYVDLYVKFKLKVLDAQREGLDTTNSFKKELEGYRKQLAKPYLTDKSVTQKLVAEAYERMKEEVNASHILIKCDPKADPKDTLAAYNRALDIRRKILAGESFDKLAREKSEDPSAKFNDGNLGFFTALQMVYPFEDLAYRTPKGTISGPVRTQFGYHIVKVLDRRPSQGQITVAHIMLRANPGMPAEDSLVIRKKIFDIWERVKKGESFAALALEFSEHADSKTKGGILPAFGTGSMVPSFENAAFALKDTGNFSQPFQTPFGWHIVKLKNRKLLEPFEDMKASLETKVSKDSRSELNKSLLLARLRRENQVVENKALMAYAFSKADSNLAKGQWKYDMADKRLDEIIFRVRDKKSTLRDFWNYAEKKQQPSNSQALEYQMRLLFKDFTDEIILDYEESHLTDKYEDYRMLVKEYNDGILLFTLMDQKVWTRALEDSAGLRQYHKDNASRYNWNQRVKATIYSASNNATLEKVKGWLAAGRLQMTDLRYEPLRFAEKNKEKGMVNGATLKTYADNFRRDKSLMVAITGYAAKDEKAAVALRRASHVADSLVAMGIERSRIQVVDSGKAGFLATPAESRRVTFRVYSSSPKAMERVANLTEPLSLNVTEGLFQREENKTMDMIPDWKPGTYTLDFNGRKNYVVVEGIEAPRQKTFEEARGAVISDYQNYLENQWIDSMKAKTTISVDESLVKKLITK